MCHRDTGRPRRHDPACGRLKVVTERDDLMDGEDREDTPSTGFHEVFRCTRVDEIRIYRLRAVVGGADLWRIEVRPGAPVRPVLEGHLKGPEEAAELLEEVRRALTAAGWR